MKWEALNSDFLYFVDKIRKKCYDNLYEKKFIEDSKHFLRR